MTYFCCKEHVEKNNCQIKYWYDDFSKLSAKEKLGWLKAEYSNEYETLTKEDKKEFIQYGKCYCRLCDSLEYYDKEDYK